MEKKKFKITGMHCSSCAINIDGELEDMAGVISANTSYARQETEVEFDSGQVSEDKIMEAIKNTGYEAKAD